MQLTLVKYVAIAIPLLGSVLGSAIDASTFVNSSPEPVKYYENGPSEEGINNVMKELDSRMTEALDQSMSQLDDVLFLNGSRYSRQLRSHVSGFKSKVVIRMTEDLTRLAHQTAQKREEDGSLSWETRLDFADTLQTTWEGTLRRQEHLVWDGGQCHGQR